MSGYTLSQDAKKMALDLGGQAFLDYVLNDFIPRMLSYPHGPDNFPLRTPSCLSYSDPDMNKDRRIVNTAWGQYYRHTHAH